MAQRLEPAAAAAVKVARVTSSDRVLDVATGTGNAALLAEERGGRIVGVDFESSLLQIAARRARDRGRGGSWLIADVMALPVLDASADVVLSVFGVMYATDHDAAARELARVAAPRARVVLASWTPGSVVPEMGRVLGSYLPSPPASSGPPSRWGDPDALVAMLGPHGLRLTATLAEQVTLRFPDAVAAADFLVGTAGHVVSERRRLMAEGRWVDLHEDLEAFVEERADHVDDHLDLTLDYLLASAINDRSSRISR